MNFIISSIALFGMFAFTSRAEEFSGIGIGLVYRPEICDKTTKPGDMMRVEYNATLTDLTHIDSSSAFGAPFEFVLGEGQVIAGWEWGLRDMCVGEIRHLSVPAQWAYGDQTIGGRMPARTTLFFDVKLLSFTNIPGAPVKSNVFSIVDTDNNGLLSRQEVAVYIRSEGIPEKPGEEGVQALLREIFQEEDRNQDGYISHSEFSGRKHDEL